MDFFAAQEQSRRRTRLLVFFYLLATLAVAAAVTAIFTGVWLWAEISPIEPDAAWLENRWRTLLGVALGTMALIALASLFRILTLRGGGARVARELGGSPVAPDTSDPLRRRLRNVVEEMAIASGVPVPEIYVLEQEAGINAFAAGYLPEDAVIAVTRGTLEQLDRDELQGVIGHEFSHVLNGDMRLNVRMLGPLFGIMVIGLIGRTLLRNLRLQRSISSTSRSRGSVPVVIVALGLAVVGWVGMLAARLIKAGVSRQREYLADASAVQFTRQPLGLSGALKKIGRLSEKSYFARADSEEVNHMLFASGQRLSGLFATHPPLLDRIQRLEPGFDGDLAQQMDDPAQATSRLPAGVSAAAADAGHRFALDAEGVPGQAGNPDASQVAAAHGLHRSIPPALYSAAHSDDQSLLLVLALVLHNDRVLRDAQLSLLGQQLGPMRAADIAELNAAVRQLGPQFRLPLLDLAFPAIKQRPAGQLQFLVELTQQLIHSDQRVELFEYCLASILKTGLFRAQSPGRRSVQRRQGQQKSRDALLDLFAIFARHGHLDPATAQAAFSAGIRKLGSNIDATAEDALRGQQDWQSSLDQALLVLTGLRPEDRRRVVTGLAQTASHDGQITIAESELLRVVCAVLDCPLPPLYAANRST